MLGDRVEMGRPPACGQSVALDSGSGAYGQAAEICTLNWCPDFYGIRALESCRARHEHLFCFSLPGSGRLHCGVAPDRVYYDGRSLIRAIRMSSGTPARTTCILIDSPIG